MGDTNKNVLRPGVAQGNQLTVSCLKPQVRQHCHQKPPPTPKAGEGLLWHAALSHPGFHQTLVQFLQCVHLFCGELSLAHSESSKSAWINENLNTITWLILLEVPWNWSVLSLFFNHWVHRVAKSQTRLKLLSTSFNQPTFRAACHQGHQHGYQSVKLKETSPPLKIYRMISITRNKQRSEYCENRKKKLKRIFDKVKHLHTLCFVGDERKFSKLLPDFSIIQTPDELLTDGKLSQVKNVSILFLS